LKYLLCARPWLPAIDYCCACFLVQPMANLRSRIRRLDRSRIASREDTLRPGWNPVDDDRRFVRKLWIPASPFPVGNTVTLPYIGLQDLTQGWQAGNSLDSDFMTLNVSWVNATSPTPPTITVTGVARPGTDFTMKSEISFPCGSAIPSLVIVPRLVGAPSPRRQVPTYQILRSRWRSSPNLR
jgi:hypothetical protein